VSGFSLFDHYMMQQNLLKFVQWWLGDLSPTGGLLRRGLASVTSGKIRKMTNSDCSAYFVQFLKSLFCNLIPYSMCWVKYVWLPGKTSHMVKLNLRYGVIYINWKLMNYRWRHSLNYDNISIQTWDATCWMSVVRPLFLTAIFGKIAFKYKK
jgi:hypothetical protein